MPNIFNSPLYRSLRTGDPETYTEKTDLEVLAESVRENEFSLEPLYQLHPNTKSEANKIFTAQAIQNRFGVSESVAFKFAEAGLQAATVEGKTHRANYAQAIATTANNWKHNTLGSLAYAMHYMFGSETFGKSADKHFSKIQHTWEDYGAVGNVLLEIESLGLTAASLALVGGVSKVAAGAIASTLGAGTAAGIASTVLGLVPTATSISLAGLSSQGANFYRLSQLKDDQGNKLDLTSPEAKFHFYLGAVTSGAITVASMMALSGNPSMQLMKGPKYFQMVLDPVAITMLKKAPAAAVSSALPITARAFIGTYQRNWTENALKYLANEQGANFDHIYAEDMLNEAFSAAKSIAIPAAIMGAVTGSARVAKQALYAKASHQAIFDTPGEAFPFEVDMGGMFRGASFKPREGWTAETGSPPPEGWAPPHGATMPGAGAAKAEPTEAPPSAATATPRPHTEEPVRVVINGPRLQPINDTEQLKIDMAKAAGETSVNVVLAGKTVEPAVTKSLADATGGEIGDDGSVTFTDEGDLELAILMAREVAVAESEDTTTHTFTLEGPEGEVTDIVLSKEIAIERADLESPSYELPPVSPYTQTQEELLDATERRMIAESIGDLVAHSGGWITQEDMDTSISLVQGISDILNIPSDELLSKHLAFELAGDLADATGAPALGRFERVGEGKFKITISQNANQSTLIHEAGHFLRAMLPQDKLALFNEAYGSIDGTGLWIEDIKEKGEAFYLGGKKYATYEDALERARAHEERFADDFVFYLGTGVAPSEEAATFFERMAVMLKKIVDAFSRFLDEKVQRAFDNLFKKRDELVTDDLHQGIPRADSPAFKRWFGDSKVVDKAGKPLVVYHNTFHDFNVFDLSKARQSQEIPGFFFANVPGQWDDMGPREIQAYVSIQNPYIGDYSSYKGIRGGSTDTAYQEIREKLIEDGYDGIISEEDDGVFEVIAFHPNQIKSIYNVGTFSIADPSVLYQSAPSAGSRQREEIARKADNLLKENGELIPFYHGSNVKIRDYDLRLRGSLTQAAGSELAFFFTKDKDVAVEYADLAAEFAPLRRRYLDVVSEKDELNEETIRVSRDDSLPEEDKDEIIEKLDERLEALYEEEWMLEEYIAGRDPFYFRDSWKGSDAPVVNEVLLAAENLMLVEGEDTDIQKAVVEAKEKGYGGVYFKGVFDSPNELAPIDNVAIFDPEDIYAIPEDVPDKNVLYQLSHNKAKELLDTNEDDVKEAVESGYFVPTRLVEQYRHTPWAQDEIAFRKQIKAYPQALEESLKYPTVDAFIEGIQNDLEAGSEIAEQISWTLEDEEWAKKAFNYARVEDPKAKDLAFAAQHNTDQSIIDLAGKLRVYQDIEDGQEIARFAAFEGVDRKVLRISSSSHAEEVAEARQIVQESPRAYRRALLAVSSAASRVGVARGGLADLTPDRELYLESLGEGIDIILQETIGFEGMLDSEVADVLMDTDIPKVRIDARARLATRRGVLRMEEKLNRELKALGVEADRKVGQLEKQLAGAKARHKEIWEELKEKRRELGKTQTRLEKSWEKRWKLVEELDRKEKMWKRRVEALDERIGRMRERDRARAIRREIDKAQQWIKRRTRFNNGYIDAMYQEPFAVIARLLDKEPFAYPAPDAMRPFFTSEMLEWIEEGRPLNDWTLGELEDLKTSVDAMRRDGRVRLEQKKVAQMARRASIATDYYKQRYGEDPTISDPEKSAIYNIKDDFYKTRPGYEESTLDAMFKTIGASIIKIHHLARMIDGNKEGVMHNHFVRKVHEMEKSKLKHVQRRLTQFEDVVKRSSVTEREMKRTRHQFTNSRKEVVKLSLQEVLGLAIYERQPEAMDKIVHPWGNNIPESEVYKAIAKLSAPEQTIAQAAIDTMDEWVRINNLLYSEYNMNMARILEYFPLRGSGVKDWGTTDLFNGPMGDSIRYTDKGFTKGRNPNAIYPVELNFIGTLRQNVKRQEHFIAYAPWVRDTNYLLTHGGVGEMIKAKVGPKMYNALLDYSKSIGSPQTILTDLDRFGNLALGNITLAKLGGNLLTVLKQTPSLATGYTHPDVNTRHLIEASVSALNPKNFIELKREIHEKSPYMAGRQIDAELHRFLESDFDTSFGKAMQQFHKKIGMKGIDIADQTVVNPLWWATYKTHLERNPNNLLGDALEKEAVFKADMIIKTTQPSSALEDLSMLQRNRTPFARVAIMFTNQIMQYTNQLWFGIPSNIAEWANAKKEGDTDAAKTARKRAFGMAANLALAAALMLVVSGQFRKRKNEDDEKYYKRIAKEIGATALTYSLPVVGDTIGNSLTGSFYDTSIFEFPSKLGRTMASIATTDAKTKKQADAQKAKFAKALKESIFAAGDLVAIPTTSIKRTERAVKNVNPLELFGRDWAGLWEDMVW